MGSDVVDLYEVDGTQVARVGGKAAALGELRRIDGLCVPAGFCVTTDAFGRAVTTERSIADRLDELAGLDRDDAPAIRRCSEGLRRAIEGTSVPDEVAEAVARSLARLGAGTPVAIRSSATAEDLPAASFAGQHDTHLGVVGLAAVLDHIVRCWASLFTERAVTYRMRNGIDHRRVHMAVVVQEMLDADAAGVLFTADPVTSDRRVASVEATLGLGEALVSGSVPVDTYEVRGDEVTARTVVTKPVALRTSPGGGIDQVPVDPSRRDRPALDDGQVLRLVRLGRRIEEHAGRPQDVEWCLVGDELHIVQSRPITTLFPVPEAGDDAAHVYVSVGHQQMMTDPMTPLGLSVWQLTTPRPMAEAGGRLFVDVAPMLASPAARDGLLQALGRSDPLIADALRTVIDRGGFDMGTTPDNAPAGPATWGGDDPVAVDPEVVADLIGRGEASIAAAAEALRGRSGPALFDAIEADIETMFDPEAIQVITTAMEASWWLDERMQEWLGETRAADALSRSVPHNITSEMGLALLDVADVVRPHPEVVDHLRRAGDDDGFLEGLADLAGGPAAQEAIRAYLDRYGMRCVGEIDIARPRWSERPRALVPLILSHVEAFEAGESDRRFARGLQEAAAAERDLLARLRALPDGEAKARETEQMIDVVRCAIGYREHPKYVMVSRYFVYRQALLAEAERLVQAGVLDERDDIAFLRFDELRETAGTHRVDRALIAERREALRSHAALTPPRVLTSDGEAVAGAYRRDGLPEDALVGLAVSAGTVEGRARVVADLAEADLAPGDILVTTHTDPSWTPLFVTAAALVTEVGGRMTHGAVIAREYGLPAVVGVHGATDLLEDGQRIRVDGTHGTVEVLADAATGSPGSEA